MSTEGCIPLPLIDVLLLLVTERFFFNFVTQMTSTNIPTYITLLRLMIMRRRETAEYVNSLLSSAKRFWPDPGIGLFQYYANGVFFFILHKKWQKGKGKGFPCHAVIPLYDCSFPSAAHQCVLCTIAKIRIITWHCGQSACTLSSTVFVCM